MKYYHSRNKHTYVRWMPGKYHSPNPGQRKPYVIQQKNGDFLDKFGKVIEREMREAHVPLEEFIFRGE